MNDTSTKGAIPKLPYSTMPDVTYDESRARPPASSQWVDTDLAKPPQGILLSTLHVAVMTRISGLPPDQAKAQASLILNGIKTQGQAVAFIEEVEQEELKKDSAL